MNHNAFIGAWLLCRILSFELVTGIVPEILPFAPNRLLFEQVSSGHQSSSSSPSHAVQISSDDLDLDASEHSTSVSSNFLSEETPGASLSFGTNLQEVDVDASPAIVAPSSPATVAPPSPAIVPPISPAIVALPSPAIAAPVSAATSLSLDTMDSDEEETLFDCASINTSKTSEVPENTNLDRISSALALVASFTFASVATRFGLQALSTNEQSSPHASPLGEIDQYVHVSNVFSNNPNVDWFLRVTTLLVPSIISSWFVALCFYLQSKRAIDSVRNNITFQHTQ